MVGLSRVGYQLERKRTLQGFDAMICKSITKTFFMLRYFIIEKILLFIFINQEIFLLLHPQ